MRYRGNTRPLLPSALHKQRHARMCDQSRRGGSNAEESSRPSPIGSPKSRLPRRSSAHEWNSEQSAVVHQQQVCTG